MRADGAVGDQPCRQIRGETDELDQVPLVVALPLREGLHRHSRFNRRDVDRESCLVAGGVDERVAGGDLLDLAGEGAEGQGREKECQTEGAGADPDRPTQDAPARGEPFLVVRLPVGEIALLTCLKIRLAMGECQGRALPWDAILAVVEPRLVTQERLLVTDEQRGQEDAACPGGDAERGGSPAGDDAIPEEQRVPEEEDRDDDNRRREGVGQMGRSHAGAQLATLQQDGDETLNAEDRERQRSSNGPELKLGKRQWWSGSIAAAAAIANRLARMSATTGRRGEFVT